jgi:DNA polymerase III delta subunit
MSSALSSLLGDIAAGNPPAVILVAGDHELSTEKAFRQIREAFGASDAPWNEEMFPAGSDLGQVLDSYRTASLFSGRRLLVLPEVNAFITRKEIAKFYEKAASDWKTAKSDRKRTSAVAKLLHVLGLLALDLEDSDSAIASAIGVARGDAVLTDLLAAARASGKRVTRGEEDASILMEAIGRGGAAGAILLLRAGELPKDSATVKLIESRGRVIKCDLSREQLPQLIADGIAEISEATSVRFDPAALATLRSRLGIDRALADKFSKEVPEIRFLLAEAERLATLVGTGGRVTAAIVEQQIGNLEGGARFELGSLFTEGKILEALTKLRELVAQARREDPKTSAEIHYGRYLFAIADEIRQMLGILSFARLNKVDVRAPMQYNRFKDLLADPCSSYLVEKGLVRQKPHPFPLFKRFEALRRRTERDLVAAQIELARIEYRRKSGGSAELGLETFLLSQTTNNGMF